MTRKRFIKLLMALGVSRNDAAVCAVTAREEHGSYAAGADAFARLLLEMCKEVAQEIAPLIMAQAEEMLAAGGGGNDVPEMQ